ncbi:MAG: 2-oxoacid:acceptor oxidoreductase family protein, partial [Archaeoglobaceae archaeon]|nr:2-oxoacid:acceptor oxidoreductase family protein [Archaeoglobaceae archaeon]
MINPQLLTLNRFEIRLAGKGGQGLIKSGLILAEALAAEGKRVLQLQSYGPEARGGASRSDVIIGDTSYPGVVSLDVLVALSQEAYDKYLHLVKPNGIVIFDSDLVKPVLIE